MPAALDAHKEEQRRFWDVQYRREPVDGSRPGFRQAAGGLYHGLRDAKEPYRRYLAPLCPGKRVLEYGCGADSSVLFFHEHGARFTGIDISSVAVETNRELCRERGVEGPEFLVMDAEATDFPDESFDLVCGWGILHHLSLERSLREIGRLLKPEGRAVFIEPLAHNPAINLFRRLTPGERNADEHPLTGGDLRLMKRYFRKASFRYFYLASLLAVPLWTTPAFRPASRALGTVDRLLFHLPLVGLLAWQVVIVLEDPIKG